MSKSHFTEDVSEGASKDCLKEDACDVNFASSYDNVAHHKDRKPFGPGMPELKEPRLGPGEHNDVGHQGFMVQPLPDGFSIPSMSFGDIRRDPYQLNESDNFDPVQAMTPRLKKSKDAAGS